MTTYAKIKARAYLDNCLYILDPLTESLKMCISETTLGYDLKCKVIFLLLSLNVNQHDYDPSFIPTLHLNIGKKSLPI